MASDKIHTYYYLAIRDDRLTKFNYKTWKEAVEARKLIKPPLQNEVRIVEATSRTPPQEEEN